ncbi:hypothetical protein AB0958_44755 [Streptomyces sp. NPDC006655]
MPERAGSHGVSGYTEARAEGDNRYSVRLIAGADDNAGGNMILAM